MQKWRYAIYLILILVLAVSIIGNGSHNLLLSFGSYYFWIGLALIICFGFIINRMRFGQ